MLITKIIRWNLGLVMAITVYGLVTDEPYWRENGHDPWLFDYFFWFALVVNGPSGFLADRLSWLTNSQAETRFLIQYILWCTLLWPQWRLYDWFIRWSHKSYRRQLAFYAFVMLLVIGGGLAAYQGWQIGHRSSEFFVDEYFWFVRMTGIACSGFILLAYAKYRQYCISVRVVLHSG